MQAFRAIILAAGRGQRMRPLTDHTPKPLLPVRGKPLIVWHLEALSRSGIQDVVINTAWLEDQFPRELGDGSRWGLRIHWSMEARDHGEALETAGGIATAMPILSPRGVEPFWVVSGDIHAPGFEFEAGIAQRFEPSSDLAHLWLVDNPAFHDQGDFALDPQGRIRPREAGNSLTYANIALMRPALLQGLMPGQRAPLGPLLHAAVQQGRLSGQRLMGAWENVGTPQQWRALTARPSPTGPPAGTAESPPGC